MEGFGEFIVVILIIGLIALVGFAIVDTQKKAMQKSAIEAGVAYYSIDSKTGVSSFNWINVNTNK